MTTNSDDSLANEGKSLWSNLLKDVKENTSVKLPPQRRLLILGDSESGKTTLISRLKNADDPKKCYGLEYQYIDVKDEDRDDQTKLGVYIFDGNIHLSYLMKYALNESNFADTLGVIVVSMQEPWNIMESLSTWFDVMRVHCDRLKIDAITREEHRQSLVRHFQEYTEPHSVAGDVYAVNGPSLVASRRHVNPLHPPAVTMTSGSNGSTVVSPIELHQDNGAFPLPDGVLEHNLGIPLVVVVTKTDTMNSLTKEHHLSEEHFDVIQMHIRRFCLARGAALFYTSVKEDKNCDLLKRYIYHRVYGFPFVQSAYIVEKDCVFVPTGWDTVKKIKIQEGNVAAHKGKVNFNEWIPKPVKTRSSNKDLEMTAKDEQLFLDQLNRELEKNQNRTVQGNDVDQQHKKSPKNRHTAATHISALKTKTYPVGSPANSAGEGVLANFFNSLLKKPNSPVQPGNAVPSITGQMPSDMENEPLNESNNNNNNNNNPSRLELQKSAGVS